LPTMIARKPIDPNKNVDGSGTKLAVKVPDCELVMLLPEEKSANTQVPLGKPAVYIYLLETVSAARCISCAK
jgi:hypothetical protein